MDESIKIRWAKPEVTREYERYSEPLKTWIAISYDETRKLLANGVTLHYNPR